MNDSAAVPIWQVVRREDDGSRYAIGKYATREEAQGVVDRFDDRGQRQLYLVERIGQTTS
jgi:hypothetical protein